MSTREKLVTEILKVTEEFQKFKLEAVMFHIACLSDKDFTPFHKEYMENMRFKFGISK